MQRDRVLLVDDDTDFRQLVAIVLRDWGLTCIEAADCASALPLVERHRDRLRAVLLDYFMPGLDPVTCARGVVARAGPDVPVILVSAAVDIGERAEELGLGRFLAKPFELSELQEMLQA